MPHPFPPIRTIFSSSNKTNILHLNAIVGSVTATLVQFISTSATSHAAWTTLEKTYVSPLHGRIMTYLQNLACPQQGNRTITNYMQDVKHNIDPLTLMNVSVDFDELSIRVLNGLHLANSNISHALQTRATPVTFEELFEQLFSYEAQMKILVPSAPLASTPTTALVTSPGPLSHCRPNNRGERTWSISTVMAPN